MALMLVPKESFAKTTENNTNKEVEKVNSDMIFAQQRFSDLLKHLEKLLDKGTRISLYKNLGESCALTYAEQLTPFKGKLKLILDEQLRQDWLQEYNLDETQGVIKLVGKPKEKCGCPLVHEGITPKEFCNCSVGHFKKVYEVVTDKKIEVELEKSILMGDKQCNFTVKF